MLNKQKPKPLSAWVFCFDEVVPSTSSARFVPSLSGVPLSLAYSLNLPYFLGVFCICMRAICVRNVPRFIPSIRDALAWFQLQCKTISSMKVSRMNGKIADTSGVALKSVRV